MNTLSSLLNFIGNQLFTDYVVEQGTEDGWVYRKWNSGIYEAWKSKSVTLTCTTARGSLYSVSDNALSEPTPESIRLFLTQEGTVALVNFATIYGWASVTGLLSTQINWKPFVYSSRNTSDYQVKFYLKTKWK